MRVVNIMTLYSTEHLLTVHVHCACIISINEASIHGDSIR